MLAAMSTAPIGGAVKRSVLQKIMSIFPVEATLAFAYGSRVKEQGKRGVHKNDMIDLILAVDDPFDFHIKNCAANPTHYSFLRKLPGGGKAVARIQENFGAKVYYNTLVPLGTFDTFDTSESDLYIKYGVISTGPLVNDLLDWETLYIAGRLHKPVEILALGGPKGDVVRKALKINIQSAIHTALLLLEESFSEKELYTTIAGISYTGDFRMIVGENRNKVENIVSPQIHEFRKLYQPYLTSNLIQPLVNWNPASRTYIQDTSSQTIYHHLSLLPKNVQKEIFLKTWDGSGSLNDIDDVMMALSQRIGADEKVRAAIKAIVKRYSWKQSIKGIFTAGIKKSIIYAKSKLVKMYSG